MKKKQPSAAESKNSKRVQDIIVHHVRTSTGKPLLAALGKRSDIGNGHLKIIKDTIAKEISSKN